MKTFCPTHCFNYTGNVCPFCEQDRINALARKHTAKPVQEKKETVKPAKKPAQDDNTPVTEDMLNALAMKFGSKRKK